MTAGSDCSMVSPLGDRTPPMTQRRQVKFLKVRAVDPPLGVHRIVLQDRLQS
jgi:hypothetical protein